jgi:hypothetical protein
MSENQTASPPKKPVMPMQPIENGRFVRNRIVEKLLEVAPIDLNDIACMDFTSNEREQFAQLIGYSVSGFGELSYTSNESYETAIKMMLGKSEQEARIEYLREALNTVRNMVKDITARLFKIHPDDLEV